MLDSSYRDFFNLNRNNAGRHQQQPSDT